MELSPEGTLVQRLEAKGLALASGVAIDQSTGAVFVTDAEADDVDVFVLEEPGPPRADALANPVPAVAPDTNETQIVGRVNPSGAPTSYSFEYGPGPCPADCTKTAPQSAGDGFGDRQETLTLASLTPGLYHYRLTAESPLGAISSTERYLPDPRPGSRATRQPRLRDGLPAQQAGGADRSTDRAKAA